MLGQAKNVLMPELERIVGEMLNDESRYMKNEMRSAHREHLVVPVNIVFKTGETHFSFSRNISGIGICLIGHHPIEDKQIADLEIYRLNNNSVNIMSGMRWCKKFGPEWYMSGWKFLQLRK